MENASLLLQMKFLSLLPCRNQSGSQSASVIYGERKQLSARLRNGSSLVLDSSAMVEREREIAGGGAGPSRRPITRAKWSLPPLASGHRGPFGVTRPSKDNEKSPGGCRIE